MAQRLGVQLFCGLRYKRLTLLDARGFSTWITVCEVGPCVSGSTRHSVVTQRPHLQGVPTSWRRQNHINEQIFINESCVGFPWWLSGKKSTCQCRRHKRLGFGPWSGRSPGERNGNPLQYSSLENPMDRKGWCGYKSMESHRTGHDYVTKQRVPEEKASKGTINRIVTEGLTPRKDI